MKKKKGVLIVSIFAFLLTGCDSLFSMFNNLPFNSGNESIDDSDSEVPFVIESDELEIEMRTSYQIEVSKNNDEEINWSSSNDKIATVENGLVSTWEEGNCIITAFTRSYQFNINVLVTPTNQGVVINETRRFLVFSDEFDGNSLDMNKWDYQLGIQDNYYGNMGPRNWGNSELQYYTKEAVSVKDGNLIITAKRENKEKMEFTSARILTRDKYSVQYGYFETRMKTPAITGMWPAFWMMPQPSSHESSGNEYGGWPYSGEIDIFEAKGSLGNSVDMTIHYGGSTYAYRSKTYHMETTTEEWHTYGLDWQENYISWYIDGELRATQKSSVWNTSSAPDSETAPFDKPFYFIYNLAVGGSYDRNKVPPEDFVSADMVVDYLRVYK